MVWSEGNMSLKNPVTPPGIDLGTVRLVAQRLDHYATPGPLTDNWHHKNRANTIRVTSNVLLRDQMESTLTE